MPNAYPFRGLETTNGLNSLQSALRFCGAGQDLFNKRLPVVRLKSVSRIKAIVHRVDESLHLSTPYGIWARSISRQELLCDTGQGLVVL